MEPRGLMAHSQGLSNNSYPEPNQPNYPHWYLYLQGHTIVTTFIISIFLDHIISAKMFWNKTLRLLWHGRWNSLLDRPYVLNNPDSSLPSMVSIFRDWNHIKIYVLMFTIKVPKNLQKFLYRRYIIKNIY